MITYHRFIAIMSGLSLLALCLVVAAAGGSSASLIGNTLTINTLNYVGLSGTFTAVYNIASAAPEPGSLALLALTGLPLVGAVVRRNRILARRHRSSASLPCPSLR